MSVEERAGAARRSLYEAVSGLERRRLPRRSRSAGLAAALAGVAAVAAVVWVLVVVSGDGEAPPVEVVAGSGELAYLVPEVPEGMTLFEVADLSQPPVRIGAIGLGSFRLYGDPDRDDPFAAGDLGVFVAEEFFEAPDADEVSVRGRFDGQFIDDWQGRGLRSLQWTDEGDVFVRLVSRSFTRGDLLEIAEDFDPTAREIPRARLPDALHVVAEHDGVGALSTGPPLPGVVDGYMLDFQDPAAGSSLTIGVFMGDRSDLEVVRWWGDPDGRTVSVRGRPGFAVPTLPLLAWLERTDLVVVISGTGLDAATLIEIGEGLQEVDEAAWNAYLEANLVLPTVEEGSPSQGTVLAQGRGRDGPWTLVVTQDPAGPTLRLRHGTGEAGVSDYAQPPTLNEATSFLVEDEAGPTTLVAGPVTPESATVVLTTESGADLDARLVDAGPHRFFVAQVLGDVGIDRIAALDSDGHILDLLTRPLPPPGPPHDPGDGPPPPRDPTS